MPKETILPLTSFRFVAAISVALFHFQSLFDFKTLTLASAAGDAITFFFVLSGFILTYHYQGMSRWSEVGHYYLARVARIWPVHLTTLTLFLCFIYYPINETILLRNVFLVQSWTSDIATAMSMNGVAWSISNELFFYLMLPLVLLTRRWLPLWVAAFAALIIFSIIMGNRAPAPVEGTLPQSWLGFVHIGPPIRFFEFLMGVVTALVFFRARRLQLPKFVWTLIEVALIGGLAWHVTTLPQRYALFYEVMGPTGIRWYTTAGSFPLMMAVVLGFAMSRGFISKALSNPVLVALGEMSFALYMCHQIIQVIWLQNGWTEFTVANAGLLGLTTFLVSMLLWRAVEQPARRVILKLADLRSVRPQVS